MKITKYIAERIAEEMTSDIMNKRESLKKEMRDFCDNIISKSLDDDLLKAYKKYSSYFGTSTCATLMNGSQELRVSTLSRFPATTSWFPIIYIEKSDAEIVDNYIIGLEKLRDVIKKTREDIISSLIALKTSKRVQSDFPDAYVYLEKYVNDKPTELSLPIENIKKTLNEYKVEQ